MPDYTYPSSDTLKNKFGAEDHAELERLEGSLVGFRRAQIDAGLGPRGRFDREHLKALHRFLFQDVYEWAGHTRDEGVRLSDGTVATEPTLRKAGGKPFLAGADIAHTLDRIVADIRDADYLRSLAPEAFAEHAADVMAEINYVHAFREGNGRAQRTFMRELAKEAGHDLDFSAITRERMIQASIAATEADDPGVMRRLFKDAVIPERRNALLEAIASLDSAAFSWNDRYIAAAEPGHPVELTLAGIAGDRFMGRTMLTIIIGRSADLPRPPPDRGERFTLEPGAWSAPDDGLEIERDDRDRGGRGRGR